MTDETNTSGFGVQKSKFNAQGTTPIIGTSTFDFVTTEGTNVKITLDNLLANLGATGTIVQDGDVLGTPVLDVQGTVHNIRNLENGSGVKASVSPENGITLDHNFISGTGGIPVLTDSALTQPKIRSIAAGSGIAVAASNGTIVISQSVVPTGSKVIIINQSSDFPTAVGNVRTLEPDTVYLIGGFIDMGSDRFIAQASTVVTGTSAFVNGIISLTTGDLFTATSGGDFSLKNLQLTVSNGRIFNYTSPTVKTGLIGLESVTIKGCQRIATLGNFAIANFTNVLVENTTVNGGLFTGTNGIGNFDTIVVSDFTGTLFDLGTAIFDLFDIENASLASSNIANIIADGLPNSGNIVVGGHATIRNTNLFGMFTDPANIVPTDLRWDFLSSNIFPNSVNRSYIAMPTNATATVIAATSTPVKIAGVWTDVIGSRFSNDTTGRATYIGQRSIIANVNITLTAMKSGAGTETYRLHVFKNGSDFPNMVSEFASDNSRDPNIALTGAINMVTNDYVELFIECITDTDNVTIASANFMIAE